MKFVDWIRERFSYFDSKISEEDIRDSGIYRELEGKYSELGRIFTQTQQTLLETRVDMAQLSTVADAKSRDNSMLKILLAEKNEKINSLCEGRNSLALSESFAVSAFKKAEQKRTLLKNLLDWNKLKIPQTVSQVEGLERLVCVLNERIEELEISFEERVGIEEEKIRKDYFDGLKILSDSYGALLRSYSYEVGAILSLGEKELGLNKDAILFLNSDFKPVFGTRQLHRVFNLSAIGDFEKNIPEYGFVIEQAHRNNSNPFCLTSGFDVKIVYARGSAGKVFGTFVIYEPRSNWRDKIPFFHGDWDRAEKVIQQNFIDPLRGTQPS